MSNAPIKYILLLGFAIVYIRLLVPYVGFFARFMFNEPTNWNKYIEKPRLVFYGIGLLLMHSTYATILQYHSQPISFFFISNCFIFLGGILMSQITWSQRFKSVFIPNIKKRLRTNKNFNISITENQLEQLYNEMVRYNMIIQDITLREDFINCLLLDWDSHDSKIHFKLDNPSCKEFYLLFKKTFPNNSLTLIDFIKNSGTVIREDGKYYNYNTVKNSLTRSDFSKSSEDLNAIFSIFS